MDDAESWCAKAELLEELDETVSAYKTAEVVERDEEEEKLSEAEGEGEFMQVHGRGELGASA